MTTNDNRTDFLRVIRDEVANLTSSPLYEQRIQTGSHPVLGEGNHHAEIMFIGEAPGRNEAKQGRPFCGAAGKILDELLASIDIPREDVYITNIVKDRPPNNRDPLPEEIAIYGPFLDRQLAIIRPPIIATLGRYSMGYVMERFGLDDKIVPISNAHGSSYATDGKEFGRRSGLSVPQNWNVTIVPLYHPAVGVYNRHTLDVLREDFKVLQLVKHLTS
ncbi:MAG: uracil-DNA glycosylase [Parcubacteria group bacterium CG08_land_8_20_14_0_20_48_21]|nr:MAG: hypothetical protein AUK21_01535 [Parcubacteria group bacterium CG2_30_48_51]PIS32889.1 MAG: uracil-DNA glycosylase [Parcubacteria group bacterium CG08_land_8_20_14_0_20_48_21]PIW78773.1 MAG: uracil-DNA glycosylase [Parcubacteria group bacterium CG_4_8_14_3_um_filter_48_16]PIY78258.1 MAG: uracil-DNA glycosylase [Parcubacteria group bacterium CG_4_10_14_0_8_um_filter_48_154]PIZ77609.1 MAG: uracil-DNA glycosylase [bacterium CG_4_10_14_0_2_um_filter_48_144]PJC39713.1 MAG: uracil-DNA glyco